MSPDLDSSRALRRLFAHLEPPIDDKQLRALTAYLDLLLRWSRRINLTGFSSPEAAAEGLLYDAVEIAPLVPKGAVVLDVGAGAGGLGVALAVFRSDVEVRFVEPRLKRATFLRAAIRELKLTSQLSVHQARAEDLPPGVRGTDVAYAQAVMPPAKWLSLAPSLVNSGGAILCLTARPLSELVDPSPKLVVEDIREYQRPISGAERVVTKLRPRA